MKPLPLEELGLAMQAAELRQELDVLLGKYDAELVLAWEGQWAYLQIQFKEDGGTNKALTLARVGRDRRVRYYTEDEEIARETARKPRPGERK